MEPSVKVKWTREPAFSCQPLEPPQSRPLPSGTVPARLATCPPPPPPLCPTPSPSGSPAQPRTAACHPAAPPLLRPRRGSCFRRTRSSRPPAGVPRRPRMQRPGCGRPCATSAAPASAPTARGGPERGRGQAGLPQSSALGMGARHVRRNQGPLPSMSPRIHVAPRTASRSPGTASASSCMQAHRAAPQRLGHRLAHADELQHLHGRPAEGTTAGSWAPKFFGKKWVFRASFAAQREPHSASCARTARCARAASPPPPLCCAPAGTTAPPSPRPPPSNHRACPPGTVALKP